MDEALKTKNALRAARDEADGNPLTDGQKRDLQWMKEKWFLEFANDLPKKLYCELAGKAHTQVDRVNDIYAIPTKGQRLDLGRILNGFHQFIADHGTKIKQAKDSRSAREEAEQRMLDIKISKAELDLAERSSKLIDRELVRRQLQWLAKQFANMAEEIGRNHGAKPQEAINEFLGTMQRELEGSDLA